MLFEDNVLDAVEAYLEKNGYQIIHRSTANQRGYDLVAERRNNRIYVEAKGQTSSKKDTKRYGKEFRHGQKKDHLTMAVLKAIQTIHQEIGLKSAIALPNDSGHIRLIESIYPSLKKLGLRIFLVNENLEVIEK